MTEDAVLARARTGDADAFAELVGPHRAALQAYCYRMLASVQDAEDAVQETLLRAWRALRGFEGRSSLRSWLYTIATNVCRRAIERRPRRIVPVDHGPPADPADGLAAPLLESAWVEPIPDAVLPAADPGGSPTARYERRESVELAFVAALQLLPARQRAVLILRDVLGFSGEEVAAALETTPTSVYSALQRAHRTIDARLPQRSQQATLRSLGDAAARAIVTDFVDAWERGDVDALVALLASDVVFAMPPTPTWFRGRADAAAFLRARPLAVGNRWRVVPVSANGQLATAHYGWDGERAAYRLHTIVVLTLRGREISELAAFRAREHLTGFGLPTTLDGGPVAG